MPRPSSTFENPFAPEKHRSTDDPALVGKILGADAEAAMRGSTTDKADRADNAEGDLVLTDAERAQIVEEKKLREIPAERARKELIAWAKEFEANGSWMEETFTIQLDGTLIVEGDLDLHSTAVTYLPRGLTKVDGTIDLNFSQFTSLEGLPQEIGGSLNLRGTHIISLQGLPKKIGKDLDLRDTHIISLEHLVPSKNSIGGAIYFRKNQELADEAIEKGYQVVYQDT